MALTEIWIAGKPPTATAQQKGRSATGAWYKPAKLRAAEQWYLWGLKSSKPAEPLEGAVILSVEFRFPAGRGHKDGDPKITRPDTDNMIKLLKDCMTKMGFWVDDAQVALELVRKSYATEPGVKIIVSSWGAAVMVDGYCRGCKYLGHITSGYCCEFLAVTGTVRGCPAGKGCARREMGGRMPSLAALQTVGKAPPKLRQARERETWDEMYERERARKARAAIACAERCKGRQRAAIVSYLEEKKMTMKQLSDLVGASPGTVGKWCAERANANWEKLARVGIVKPEGL